MITITAIDPSKSVAMVPFFYISYEKGDLGLSQVAGGDQGLTKLLKVSREKEQEFFEFMSMSLDQEHPNFNVFGMKRLD